MGVFDLYKKFVSESNQDPAPQEEGPATNEYGDIVISMEEFNALTKRYNVWPSQINNVKFATYNNTMNGFNIVNNVVTINIRGKQRQYDTRSLRAVFVDKTKTYVVLSGNAPRPSRGSHSNIDFVDNEDEDDDSGVNESFDLDGVQKVVIDAGSADVTIKTGSGEEAKVCCEDGGSASVNGNTLSIDGTDATDVTITLPKAIKKLQVSVSTSSGDVEIHGLTCRSLALNTASGDIDAKVTTSRLNVNTASGDVTVTQTYNDDGEANISTASGDIEYDPRCVNNLTVNCSDEYDDEFESDEDGFDAEVNISTASGDITIG